MISTVRYKIITLLMLVVLFLCVFQSGIVVVSFQKGYNTGHFKGKAVGLAEGWSNCPVPPTIRIIPKKPDEQV